MSEYFDNLRNLREEWIEKVADKMEVDGITKSGERLGFIQGWAFGLASSLQSKLAESCRLDWGFDSKVDDSDVIWQIWVHELGV